MSGRGSSCARSWTGRSARRASIIALTPIASPSTGPASKRCRSPGRAAWRRAGPGSRPLPRGTGDWRRRRRGRYSAQSGGHRRAAGHVQQATGDGLQFTSDKLAGRASLVVDLRTGKFDVGLSGALGRYLIPGIGLVDVRSTLKVVPTRRDAGTRVLGRGTAQVLRLDNAFFRSLAGGLPRIETGLERTSDGILHFRTWC
jgi:hypothetical protein